VFRGFASRIGKPEDWGKAPLSLPPDDWPHLLPLRVAFDTRKGVDAVLRPLGGDKQRALWVSTLALAMLLEDSSNAVEPRSALALVFETINGMAKTAPMLKAITTPTAAMREAQHKVVAVGEAGAAVKAPRRSGRIVIESPRLGVLNLLGPQGAALASADLKALGPLFGKAVESSSAPPQCDVLLLYARISDAGKVARSDLGLREIIRDSGARVVIVASENSGDAYTACAPETGYGKANLVMIMEREGDNFSKFFVRLFKKMFEGTTMPMAWVQLAPQIPGAKHTDVPGAIFDAEAGQVTFR